MKSLFSTMLLAGCCAAVGLTTTSALANPQQNKMVACNKEAADKKGDERKAFMKDCLSAKPAATKLTPQQDKMKSCNADAKAKTLKGDERKAFMKSCLSASK